VPYRTSDFPPCSKSHLGSRSHRLRLCLGPSTVPVRAPSADQSLRADARDPGSPSATHPSPTRDRSTTLEGPEPAILAGRKCRQSAAPLRTLIARGKSPPTLRILSHSYPITGPNPRADSQ